MGKDNGIWAFVEDKMKCTVPPYFKNILEVCGFTNGMTIATIEENDITYLEDEVKNGNVFKYFENVKDMNVLEGSNKTEKDFEFIRGHKKFLLAIRDFLKNHLERNGPDSFNLEASTHRKPLMQPKNVGDENLFCVPLKRKKSSMDSSVKTKIQVYRHENIIKDGSDDMIQHRKVIYTKCIKALCKLPPNLLVECKEKFSSDSIKTEMKSFEDKDKSSSEEEGNSHKKYKMTGAVRCPCCPDITIAVHHEPSHKNFFLWKTTNWSRHLKNTHGAANNICNGKQGSTEKMPSDIETKSNENVAVASESNEIENVAIKSKSNETETVEIVSKSNDIETLAIPSESNNSNASWSPKTEILNVNLDFKSRLVSYSDSSENSEDDDQSLDVPQGNELDGKEIAKIPIFRNGHTSIYSGRNSKQTIVTYNTCGFDSIFLLYTSLYFDDPHFRETFIGHSKFTALVKAYFDAFNGNSELKSAEFEAELKKLYNDRNIILKEIFSRNYYKNSKAITKKGDILHIDCVTGIAGLFGQICLDMSQQIGSAIETKTCEKCKKTTTKVVPLISVDPIGLDIHNLQDSICLKLSKNRSCKYCRGRCIMDIVYNKVLALETEPNTTIKFQKTISIRNISQTISIVDQNDYNLFAIIQFDPKIRHFKSHVKRKNIEWFTYDDIQLTEVKTNEDDEILPYMVFYIKNGIDSKIDSMFLDRLNRNISTQENRLENKSSTQSMSCKKMELERNWKKY